MLLNIKFEPKQIDNDWGFYVDIENNSFPENKLNYEIKREKYKIKNINEMNKLKKCNNLIEKEDDWGFYVDIENNSFPENKLNYDFKREKYINKFKKYNNLIQYFETNYEEYDIYSNITENDNKNNKFINFILKVSLTSFITAIIIYIIFVVL